MSTPAEETDKRQVLLHEDGSTYTVSINTTSLVFAQKDEEDESSSDDSSEETVGIDDQEDEDPYQEEEVVIPFHKKDYWKTT